MLPKLVSLGIILDPPLSPSRWVEWILSPPRAAWAVRPCGESRGGWFARRTEMTAVWVLLKPSVENPPHRDRMPGRKVQDPVVGFSFGIHFWLPFSKIGRILGGDEDQHALLGGEVVQLILRGAVRRPQKKSRSKSTPGFWQIIFWKRFTSSISAKLQRIPEFRKSFFSARWMDFQFNHRKMFTKRQLVCFDKADLIKRKLKIHEMFDSERCIFKNKIHDLYNTNSNL